MRSCTSRPRPTFNGATRFHRRKAVAPLKDHQHGRQRDDDDRFHRRKAVAPLKVGLGLEVQLRMARFHRRKAVAPLKAR